MQLRSFINCVYGRAAAIALVRKPGGSQLFQSQYEMHESSFAIPARVGSLLYALSYVSSDATLPELFESIKEGSDLLTVAPVFNHWLIVNETQDQPADFGLNELRAAALLITARRVANIRQFMTDAQLQTHRRILRSRGARQCVSSKAQTAFAEYWRSEAQTIVEQQTYEPARWLAKACQCVINDSPGAAALCVSGHFGGERPVGITKRLMQKSIELLAECPVRP